MLCLVVVCPSFDMLASDSHIYTHVDTPCYDPAGSHVLYALVPLCVYVCVCVCDFAH
jgi:hypothetical protein